jgi:hypothetical protein
MKYNFTTNAKGKKRGHGVSKGSQAIKACVNTHAIATTSAQYKNIKILEVQIMRVRKTLKRLGVATALLFFSCQAATPQLVKVQSTGPLVIVPASAADSAAAVGAAGTITFGSSGSALGVINLAGSTSGSAMVTVPVAAGTGTLFQLPANNGTVGQVLRTDGSGHLTWITTGAGSGTVTNVATNAGLTGGPITTTGTIGIANGGIQDVMVSATAAIQGTKITPAFGQQLISAHCTGGDDASVLTIGNAANATISVINSNGSADGEFVLYNHNGNPRLDFSATTDVLGLFGSTSGNVSITTAAAAGTWTFTLPTSGGTNNYPLLTNGSGGTSWGILPVAGGGTGLSSAGADGTALMTNGSSPTWVTGLRLGATGGANTGSLSLKGKTSGGLLIQPVDAAGQTVTLSLAAQTVGAGTVTIPDLASTTGKFVVDTLAQTESNKTFTAPVINGCTSSGSTAIDFSGNSGAFKATTGHITLEGVTSTGATGTGKFVFDTSPTLTTPNLGTPSALVATNVTALNATQLTTGTVPVARYAVGTVCQKIVSQLTAGGDISSTSSTYATTGLSVTITPVASGNKMKVEFWSGSCGTSTNATTMLLKIKRTIGGGAATDLVVIAAPHGNIVQGVPALIRYYDSPATSSAVKYELFYASSDNASTAWWLLTSLASNFIHSCEVEEIAQ